MQIKIFNIIVASLLFAETNVQAQAIAENTAITDNEVTDNTVAANEIINENNNMENNTVTDNAVVNNEVIDENNNMGNNTVTDDKVTNNTNLENNSAENNNQPAYADNQLSQYVKDLNLDPDQLYLAQKISEEDRAKREQILTSLYVIQKQARELENSSIEKFMAVLNDEQKQKFQELLQKQKEIRQKNDTIPEDIKKTKENMMTFSDREAQLHQINSQRKSSHRNPKISE